MKISTLICSIVYLLLCCRLAAVEPQELILLRALPVDSDRPLEPSGMIKRGPDLFIVSDSEDSTIYKLVLEDTRARAEPALRFYAQPSPGVRKLDFEGISCDDEGNFYLISESTYRILRVRKEDGAADWIGPDLREAGRNAGLFQVGNGGLEGIAVVSPQKFFLGAERQARGILELQLTSKPSISAWNCDKSNIISGHGARLPDFSDLFWDQGRLFAIVRGAEAIVELEKTGNDFRELAIWSMAQTLTNPEYVYEDRTFGMAEGLCLDSERVYVVLDNNGDARERDPNDRRPLLFIFRRPR